jgi:hypothetical protein
MHQPKNILRTLVSFASRDGIPSLWTGLTGSWLRQCSYSTARFGLYNYFAKEVKQRTGTTKLTAGWEVVSECVRMVLKLLLRDITMEIRSVRCIGLLRRRVCRLSAEV